MRRDPEIQFRSPERIRSFQAELLREEIDYVAGRSAFYRRMFASEKIDPASIRTPDDLRRLPVTTKKDLQSRCEEFLCVPADEVIDYVTTSGTLGEPVTFCLTESDLDRLAYNELLSFSTAGCGRGDILQLMTTIDRRFMAGLAYFMGARKLGCGVVRVGNGIPELQWDTILRVRPTACVVVPSFLLRLIDYATQHGIDYRRSPLRRAVCIGEALRSPNGAFTALGERIHLLWPELELYSTYASTEMQTSFTECEYHAGGHLMPDLIIVEVLDDNGRQVAEGQTGEVTVTTLGVRGMPLVRFATGDMCTFSTAPCRCGRNTVRLSSVLGRKSQMIKFKGTTVYPPALYDVLDDVPQVDSYMVEAYTNDIGTDGIRIRIASSDRSDGFVGHLKNIFRAKVRVAPEIVFDTAERIEARQSPAMSRKKIKFVDLRESR